MEFEKLELVSMKIEEYKNWRVFTFGILIPVMILFLERKKSNKKTLFWKIEEKVLCDSGLQWTFLFPVIMQQIEGSLITFFWFKSFDRRKMNE